MHQPGPRTHTQTRSHTRTHSHPRLGRKVSRERPANNLLRSPAGPAPRPRSAAHRAHAAAQPRRRPPVSTGRPSPGRESPAKLRRAEPGKKGKGGAAEKRLRGAPPPPPSLLSLAPAKVTAVVRGTSFAVRKGGEGVLGGGLGASLWDLIAGYKWGCWNFKRQQAVVGW